MITGAAQPAPSVAPTSTRTLNPTQTQQSHLRDTASDMCMLTGQALGATTLLLYATHLMVRHRHFDPPFVRKPFSVRVVVPCYKEDIETLEETVECAIKAAKIAMDKGQANAGTLGIVQSQDACMIACMSW